MSLMITLQRRRCLFRSEVKQAGGTVVVPSTFPRESDTIESAEISSGLKLTDAELLELHAVLS
jgi:hypothetical protein